MVQNYVIANESDQSIEVNSDKAVGQVNAIHAGDGNDKIVNKGPLVSKLGPMKVMIASIGGSVMIF